MLRWFLPKISARTPKVSGFQCLFNLACSPVFTQEQLVSAWNDLPSGPPGHLWCPIFNLLSPSTIRGPELGGFIYYYLTRYQLIPDTVSQYFGLFRMNRAFHIGCYQVKDWCIWSRSLQCIHCHFWWRSWPYRASCIFHFSSHCSFRFGSNAINLGLNWASKIGNP